jgi:hypothetical protein
MEEFSPPIRTLKSSIPAHEPVSNYNTILSYVVVPIAILSMVTLIYLGVMWFRKESQLNREILNQFLEKEHQLAQERAERFFEKLENKLSINTSQTKIQPANLPIHQSIKTST